MYRHKDACQGREYIYYYVAADHEVYKIPSQTFYKYCHLINIQQLFIPHSLFGG